VYTKTRSQIGRLPALDRLCKDEACVVERPTLLVAWINADKRRPASLYIETTKEKRLSEDDLFVLFNTKDMVAQPPTIPRKARMTDLKEPSRAEAEAQLITEFSDADLREYIHRGKTERWLSGVVRRLNRLEQRPATRNLAQCALRRLGFPVSG
jgi:hypothetical protein